MNEEEPVSEEESQPDEMLCPSCAESNPPLQDFCKHCGRPLGIIATHGFLESVWAQGWIYGKAAGGTSRPIVLVGIWLILGPAGCIPL